MLGKATRRLAREHCVHRLGERVNVSRRRQVIVRQSQAVRIELAGEHIRIVLRRRIDFCADARDRAVTCIDARDAEVSDLHDLLVGSKKWNQLIAGRFGTNKLTRVRQNNSG